MRTPGARSPDDDRETPARGGWFGAAWWPAGRCRPSTGTVHSAHPVVWRCGRVVLSQQSGADDVARAGGRGRNDLQYAIRSKLTSAGYDITAVTDGRVALMEATAAPPDPRNGDRAMRGRNHESLPAVTSHRSDTARASGSGIPASADLRRASSSRLVPVAIRLCTAALRPVLVCRGGTPAQVHSEGPSWALCCSALCCWAWCSWSSRVMMRQAASIGVPWLTSSRTRAAKRSW